MGRTFPNFEGRRVDQAGYYFSLPLSKLARLGVGEKLPNRGGPWAFIAPEHAMTSSQAMQEVLRRFPEVERARLSYTVRTPLGTRFPLGETPRAHLAALITAAAGALLLGWALGFSAGARRRARRRP